MWKYPRHDNERPMKEINIYEYNEWFSPKSGFEILTDTTYSLDNMIPYI